MKKLAILTLIFCIVMMFATACFQPSGGGEGGSGEQGGEGGSGEGEGGGSGEGEGGGSGEGEGGGSGEGEGGGSGEGEGGGDQPGEGGGDQPGEGGGDQPGEGGGDQPGEGGGDQPGEGGGDQPGEGGGDQPGEGGGDDPIEVVKPAAPSADLFAGVPSGDLGFDYGADNLNEEAYEEAISPNGWVAQNVKVFVGGEDHEMFGDSYALVLNGAPATAGYVTSGLIGNGISSFSFNYGFVYAADTQFSITITIYQLVDGEVKAVDSTVVEIKDIEAETKYSYTWNLETALTGNYVIQIANNCLSGEKDRVAIWDLSWAGVVPPVVDFGCMPIKDALEIDNQGKNNSYAIVDKDGSGVLKLVKTNQDDEGNVVGSGTNEFRKNQRVFQYVNTKEENANKAVFTAKFFIEKIEGADPAFEFFLRGGDGLGITETTMKQSPMFLECTAKNAEAGKILCNHNAKNDYGAPFTINIGEWIDIKIEYTITRVNAEGTLATGMKAEYFINGESKLSSTVVYGAELTPNGGETPLPFADEITHMCFILYTNNIGVYYFDDMSLNLVYDETVAAPEKDAPCEHRDADDDKKCDKCKVDWDDGPDAPVYAEDFNDSDYSSITIVNATPTIVDRADGDKALKVVKDGSTASFTVSKTYCNEENANTTIFGFDLYIEEVTANGAIEMWMNGEGNNKIPYITLAANGTTTAKELRKGASAVDAGIKYGEWNTILVRYYNETSTYDFLVNGKLVYTSSAEQTNTGAPLGAVKSVKVSFSSSFKGTFQLDNFTFSNVKYDNNSVITFDKEVGKDFLETNGANADINCTVSTEAAFNGKDKVLLFHKEYGKYNDKSVNMGLTIKTTQEWYKANGIVAEFDMWSANNNIELYINGVYTNIVLGSQIACPKGEWVHVVIEYRPASGDNVASIRVIIGGNEKVSESFRGTPPATVDDFVSLKLSLNSSAQGDYAFDNIKVAKTTLAPIVSEFAKKFDGNYEVAGPDGVAFTFAFTPDKDNGNNGTLVLVDSYHAEDASLSGTYTYAVGKDNAVVVKDASGADMTEKFNFSMNLGGGIAFQWAGVPMAQDLVAAAAAE